MTFREGCGRLDRVVWLKEQAASKQFGSKALLFSTVNGQENIYIYLKMDFKKYNVMNHESINHECKTQNFFFVNNTHT